MVLGRLGVALGSPLALRVACELRRDFNVNVAPESMGSGELSAGSRIWVVGGLRVHVPPHCAPDVALVSLIQDLAAARPQWGVLTKWLNGRSLSPSAPQPVSKRPILALFGAPFGVLGGGPLLISRFGRLGQPAQ